MNNYTRVRCAKCGGTISSHLQPRELCSVCDPPPISELSCASAPRTHCTLCGGTIRTELMPSEMCFSCLSRRRYLSDEHQRAMLRDQNGCCELCRLPISLDVDGERPAIVHVERRGSVLLCSVCVGTMSQVSDPVRRLIRLLG